jgi:hypothetical protein
MPAVKKEGQMQEGPCVKIPVAGVRVPLPPRQNLFYYGGLGAMTALELIDWPVTLAVAAGYALATRDRHEENGQ